MFFFGIWNPTKHENVLHNMNEWLKQCKDQTYYCHWPTITWHQEKNKCGHCWLVLSFRNGGFVSLLPLRLRWNLGALSSHWNIERALKSWSDFYIAVIPWRGFLKAGRSSTPRRHWITLTLERKKERITSRVIKLSPKQPQSENVTMD